MTDRLSIPEIAVLCTNPAEGCFRDNTEVLETMLDMDDGGVRRYLEKSGAWGFDAAQSGLAPKGLNLYGRPIVTVETGPHNLGVQAALCGYNCGAIAAGQCSVFKPSAFKPAA